MFNRRNFNFNIDELIARYDKMMEDFHKTDWSEKSYESPDGSYKITSYYKVFDLNDFDSLAYSGGAAEAFAEESTFKAYTKFKGDAPSDVIDIDKIPVLIQKIKKLKN